MFVTNYWRETRHNILKQKNSEWGRRDVMYKIDCGNAESV